MRALTFLQTDLAATVDHSDTEETTEVSEGLHVVVFWVKEMTSVCNLCLTI